MFFKKAQPALPDKLTTSQLVERFRGEVRDAIDAATEGRDDDWRLQHDLAQALKGAASAIDFRRAIRQPL